MLDSHRTWTEISILCVAWSVSHLCEVERQLLLEGFTAWKAAFWCFYVISNVEKKQQVQRNTDPIPPPTMHSVATFITLPCRDLLHHCPLVVRKCSKGPSTLKQTQELPQPWQHRPFFGSDMSCTCWQTSTWSCTWWTSPPRKGSSRRRPECVVTTANRRLMRLSAFAWTPPGTPCRYQL